MRTYILYTLALVLLAACGEKPTSLEEKKNQLKSYKDELADIKGKIDSLETEIRELDPEYMNGSSRSVLVTAISTEEKLFQHKIELRGSVESRKNVFISSEIPGKIERIRVREGQPVSKGMVLIELDADIIRNNIAELKTSLDLANIVYERQDKLWKQNIGTEIQYLEAKNNKESLERKLATANSELARAIIRAPFSGSIDEIPAKEGEMAQPGTPLVRIVNPNDVYIRADVSERFIGKFRSGDETDVYFPTQDKNIKSNILSVSQVINSENRTFEIEIAVPSVDFPLKPNQVSVIRLIDYMNTSAITVPTRLIQKDDIGTFVYVVKEEEEGMIARKNHITTGVSYNNETEVVKGLDVDAKIVDKGYRDISDGVLVSLLGENEQSLAVKN